MTLMRMPVFTWMMLVVAFLTVFAMPIITAAMIMVFFDRNFDTTFFLASKGGDPLLYQHLFWLFGHPEVYILILPGMGIVSEVLPVFSRKPLFGYSVVVFSGIAIGFLGWGVWAHHMFATGLGPVAISAFGLSTMLIAIPTGVKIFNWLGTVYGGSVKLTTAMLFSLGFIAMFTIGGLSGVLHSIVPGRHAADRHLLRRRALPLRAVRRADVRDLLRLLLLVAEDLRADARRAPRQVELLADARSASTSRSSRCTSSACIGMPRRTYRYADGLGLGHAEPDRDHRRVHHRARRSLVFLVNVIYTRQARAKVAAPTRGTAARSSGRSRRRRPSTTSPRSREVEARDDWWHRKYTEDAEGRLVRLPAGGAIERGRRPTTDRSPRSRATERGHGIHMPSPSFYPLVVALGLPFLGYAAVFLNPWLAIPGLLLAAVRHLRVGPRAGDRAGAHGDRSGSCPSRSVHRDRRSTSARRATLPAVPARHDTAHDDATPGSTNTKLGDVAVPVVRLPVLRRVHRHVPALPRPRRAGRARRRRTSSTSRSRRSTSFILLMSSLTMVLALAAIQRGDHRRFRIWILATALFGATFIGGQIFEFTEFTREGLNLDTNLFGSSFFVLTGLHGAHVTVGIVWLLSLWGLSMQEPHRARATPSASRSPASTGTSSTWCGS